MGVQLLRFDRQQLCSPSSFCPACWLLPLEPPSRWLELELVAKCLTSLSLSLSREKAGALCSPKLLDLVLPQSLTLPTDFMEPGGLSLPQYPPLSSLPPPLSVLHPLCSLPLS